MTLQPAHTDWSRIDTSSSGCAHRWTPWGSVGPDSEKRRDCLNCGTFEVQVDVAPLLGTNPLLGIE